METIQANEPLVPAEVPNEVNTLEFKFKTKYLGIPETYHQIQITTLKTTLLRNIDNVQNKAKIALKKVAMEGKHLFSGAGSEGGRGL